MNYRDFFKEDVLPIGKGNVSPTNIHPAELAMGIKVEMEHTEDVALAKKIAQDHLKEDPHYYTKLKQSGLADELETKDNGVIEPNTNAVDKQTAPATVFPEVPNDPSKGPDMVGCIGSTNNMETKDKTDVEAPAKDPQPTDHITGGIGSTPSNPNILSKQSGQCGGGAPIMQTMMKALMPKDISIDIAEGKNILEKMKKESLSPTTKGAATSFGPKQEGFVPAAGDPDKDPHFVKGKRWTVKWENNQSK